MRTVLERRLIKQHPRVVAKKPMQQLCIAVGLDLTNSGLELPGLSSVHDYNRAFANCPMQDVYQEDLRFGGPQNMAAASASLSCLTPVQM